MNGEAKHNGVADTRALGDLSIHQGECHCLMVKGKPRSESFKAAFGSMKNRTNQ